MSYIEESSEQKARRYLLAAEQNSGSNRQAARENANTVIDILEGCVTKEAKGYRDRARTVLAKN